MYSFTSRKLATLACAAVAAATLSTGSAQAGSHDDALIIGGAIVGSVVLGGLIAAGTYDHGTTYVYEVDDYDCWRERVIVRVTKRGRPVYRTVTVCE